jgi:hypothetical protein
MHREVPDGVMPNAYRIRQLLLHIYTSQGYLAVMGGSRVRAPWQPVCHSGRRLLYEGYMAALQGIFKLLALMRWEKGGKGVSLLSWGRSGADKALSLGGP